MLKTVQLLLKLQGAVKLLGLREMKGTITTLFIDVKMSNGKYRMYDIQYTDTHIVSSSTGFDVEDCFTEYDSYDELINNLISTVEQDKIHNNRLTYYAELCDKLVQNVLQINGVNSATLYKVPEPTLVVHYMINGKIQEPLVINIFKKKSTITNEVSRMILQLLEGN